MTAAGPTAEFYANWNDARIRNLQVLPPYESKDNKSTWVRGTIRHRSLDGVLRELVVTGPKMKICYGGCRWNRMVFAMNGAADAEVYAFEKWVRNLADHVKNVIYADPGKYKPGATSATRFLFDDDIIKPSSDCALYPDELRCRLSSKRVAEGDDVVDADLFLYSENGDHQPIHASEITAGSFIIPIIKFAYNRNIERFGMVMTVLKGMVFPADNNTYRIDNKEWEIDYPMEI